MSVKIVAYAPYVENHLQLLEKNLMLPVEELNNPKDYYPGFEKDFILKDALWDTLPIVYAAYFDKDGSLRHEYFDVIRAMGLKEIWVMNEMLIDYIGDFPDGEKSISDFLSRLDEEIKYDDNTATIKEFDINNFTYDEEGRCYNYYDIYHDTFKDCFEEVEAIEKQYNVHVLGLNKFEKDYIRVVPNVGNKEVSLLNPETGEMRPCVL